MKTFGLLLTGVLATHTLAQYPSWTIPTRITSDTVAELHPVFADGDGWLYNQEEMLAYSRNGRDICILRTTSLGAAWSDSITFITTDGADHDYPSLLRRFLYPSQTEEAIVVWQGKRNNTLDIFFSKLTLNRWSNPEPITNNQVDDQQPHVLVNDSIYYVVWDQQGKIMFSEYRQGIWTAPITLSAPDDTLNHFPQLTLLYHYPPPMNHPAVVWQRRRENTRFHSLMVAYRSATGWSAPAALISDGDNRRPRFFKYGQQQVLTWNKRVGSSAFFNVYAGTLSLSGSGATLQSIYPLTSYDDTTQNASINGFMLVTERRAPYYFYSTGAWELPRNDSIEVALRPYGPYGTSRLSAGGAPFNRAPSISQGTPVYNGGWHMRFWVVWEALVRNTWHLYASNALLLIDNVEGAPNRPQSFALYQNYPNPFTSATHIAFSLPVGQAGVQGSGFVSLKVYDVLGREVATLVNEVLREESFGQGSGFKSVVFDASNLPSGVYFYRLQAGGFSQTRKFVLMR